MGLLAIGRWLGALIGRCGGGQAPYPLGQGWAAPTLPFGASDTTLSAEAGPEARGYYQGQGSRAQLLSSVGGLQPPFIWAVKGFHTLIILGKDPGLHLSYRWGGPRKPCIQMLGP